MNFILFTVYFKLLFHECLEICEFCAHDASFFSTLEPEAENRSQLIILMTIVIPVIITVCGVSKYVCIYFLFCVCVIPSN